MPISDRQLAANRANAQLSTGPTSPEGKLKSSQNARRHGITAQTTVMADEDRLHHDDFCNKMMADLAPLGSMELFLASSVAEEAWRLNNARAQCNNIIAIGHFDNADTWHSEHPEIQNAVTEARVVRDHAKTLELLSLYEQRIHRSFQKHYDELKKVQAERKAKEAVDMESARLLSQLAKVQHLPYVPARDGFAFSNDEIDYYIELYHRRVLSKKEQYLYRKMFDLEDLPKLPKAA